MGTDRPREPQAVILDTDIGSDIDDALALLLLLHLQNAQLLGVTTVYGNVELRAKIARRILQAACADVPVIASMGNPMSSPIPIWHTGAEGEGLLKAEDIQTPLEDCGLMAGAPEFLADQALRFPGEVTILAIGALTNLARALEIEPRFATAVSRVVFMGGGVTYPAPMPKELSVGTEYWASPSHNIRCDVAAAKKVFQSGLKIIALTNDVTTAIWWDGETVQQMLRAESPPETVAVGKLLRVWLNYRSRVFRRSITGTCPHDPLTAAEAAHPGRFVQYAGGEIRVHADGSTTFTPVPGGRHQVSIGVEGKAFLAWMAPRLLGPHG
jgi:purine nucleosidase